METQGEDRNQFPRGLLTPDFKGEKNSHTVTAARGAKSWGITSVCLCALISNSGELHLKTVDDVKKGATYGKMASLQPNK